MCDSGRLSFHGVSLRLSNLQCAMELAVGVLAYCDVFHCEDLHTLSVLQGCFFTGIWKTGEPKIQQIPVPFKVSRIDSFLGKSQVRGWEFPSDLLSLVRMLGVLISGEWAGFDFSGASLGVVNS